VRNYFGWLNYSTVRATHVKFAKLASNQLPKFLSFSKKKLACSELPSLERL